MKAGRKKAKNKSVGMPSCTFLKRLPNLKQCGVQSLRDGEDVRFVRLGDEIVSGIFTSNSEDLSRQTVVPLKRDGQASCLPAMEELTVSGTTIWGRVTLSGEHNPIPLFVISDPPNPAYLACQRNSLNCNCPG